MLTKYAEFEVIEVRHALTSHSPRLRTAHRVAFDYTPRAGYIYVRSRAISSRCNDNYDEFPAPEIKAAYRSFVGKPVFVNHHNSDHRRARGVIIDAALHEDTNPDGTPDTWAEVLMEVDAVRFPVLAREVEAGNIARTSMGTDVAYSICTACGNRAVTPADYCTHIPRMKGMKLRRKNASTGADEEVLIAERCYGLRFFENSLLVEDPADPTAYVIGVTSGDSIGKAAARQVIDEAEGIVAGAVQRLAREQHEWDQQDEEEHPRANDGEFRQKGTPAGPKAPQQAPAAPGGGSRGPVPKPPKSDWKSAPADSDKGSGKAPETFATDADKTGPRHAGTKADPIPTSDVEEAARHLAAGRWVDLRQPKKVATLVDRLGQIMAEERKKGNKQTINLCQVTVKGTNLFCVESKGVPRIKMPQLNVAAADVPEDAPAHKYVRKDKPDRVDLSQPFRQMLIDRGVKINVEDEKVAYLKATQNELNAGKVANAADEFRGLDEAGRRQGPWGEPLFVSNDNYIVDGHHRWAARIAVDYEDGKADMSMPVERIDMPIVELLYEANQFANGLGVMGLDMSKISRLALLATQDCGCGGPQTAVQRLAAEFGNQNSGYAPAMKEHNITNVRDIGRHPQAESLVSYSIHMGDDVIVTGKYNPEDFDSFHEETVDVPIDQIRFKEGQSHVLHPYVEHLAKIPQSRFNQDDLPFGQRMPDGTVLMMEGHHRAAAASYRGDKTLRMVVYGKWGPGARAKSTSTPGGKKANMHLGYGETKAPAKVDTMRAEACPVCGDDESFNGEKCNVCGYVEPPSQFRDPDLTKAREMDLRQDKAEQMKPEQPFDAKAPQAEDLECTNCGEVFSAEGEPATKPHDDAKEAPPEADPEHPRPPEDPDREKADPRDLTDLVDKTDRELGLEDEDEDDEQDEVKKPKRPLLPGDRPDENSLAEGEGRVTPDGQDEKKPEQSPTDELKGLKVEPNMTCPVCGQGTLVPVAKQPVPGDPPSKQVGTDPARNVPKGASKDMPRTPNPAQQRRNQIIAAILEQQEVIEQQADQIQALTAGLATIAVAANLGGHPKFAGIVRAAGLSTTAGDMYYEMKCPKCGLQSQYIDRYDHCDKCGTAISIKEHGAGPDAHRKGSARRVADSADNPSGAPSTTTEEAKKPQATDDVNSVGAAPGEVNKDVTPSGVTDVQNSNVSGNPPVLDNLQDVTKANSGTDAPTPEAATGRGRIEVGTPSNDTKDSNTWKSSAIEDQARFVSSMRLARLQIEAGLAPEGTEDLSLGQQIKESAASRSEIEAQIDVLAQMRAKAVAQPSAQQRRNLVPRSASRQPIASASQPSLQGTAGITAAVSNRPEDDEWLVGDAEN